MKHKFEKIGKINWNNMDPSALLSLLGKSVRIVNN